MRYVIILLTLQALVGCTDSTQLSPFNVVPENIVTLPAEDSTVPINSLDVVPLPEPEELVEEPSPTPTVLIISEVESLAPVPEPIEPSPAINLITGSDSSWDCELSQGVTASTIELQFYEDGTGFAKQPTLHFNFYWERDSPTLTIHAGSQTMYWYSLNLFSTNTDIFLTAINASSQDVICQLLTH